MVRRQITFKTARDEIIFAGHPNVLGTHRNTLEITKEEEISRRADCIIGVRADKACHTLNESLKKQIKSGCGLNFLLVVQDLKFAFRGFGSSKLTLDDEKEIVMRISDFESPRTLAIKCSASALDIPRSMIELLKNPAQAGKLEIESANDRQNEKVPWKLLE